jgi:Ca2+-binding EF-hand superfamily protein
MISALKTKGDPVPEAAPGSLKRSLTQTDPPMTTVERKVFSNYFSEMDKDNNGEVSYYELKGFLTNLGFNPTDNDVKTMMREADTSKDGAMDFNEFVSVIRAAENFKTTENWRRAQGKIANDLYLANRSKK